MKQTEKIWIAGRTGLAGSAIERKLKKEGYQNIIGLSSKELNLTRQKEVEEYYQTEKPKYVILAAAKVGGIAENIKAPADFLYDNMAIEVNMIHYAAKYHIKKFLFLASSCIYPRDCPQPMKEDYLLTGKPEPSNEAYAIAKITGLRMCEFYNRQYPTQFISVMPCNLYGIGDHFYGDKAHLVAALIRKIHEAKKNKRKEVEIWGSGQARRELMFSEDLADACYELFQSYKGREFINIGTGIDYSIEEIATTIKNVIGYEGGLVYNKNKPEGMPQKLLDIEKAARRGWEAKVSLEKG